MLGRALLSLFVTLPTFAAPVPKKTSNPVTVANAADLRLVKELERTSSPQLGPVSGQVTLVEYARSVEVVDDIEFKPVKDSSSGLKPLYLATSADGRYRAWVEQKAPKYVLEDVAGKKTTEIEFGGSGSSCPISPDGKTLAIGYNVFPPAMPNGYSESRLYDTATGKLLHTLEQDGQGGLTPVFSPDGKMLTLGNRNYPTKVFEVKTGKLLHKMSREMTQGIAFSPDGSKLAAAYVDGKVAVWDVASRGCYAFNGFRCCSLAG